MAAQYQSKNQNRQDETTVYWFSLDGEEVGIAERGPDVFAVDSDGHPIDYNEDLAREVMNACTVTEAMRAE